MKNWKEYLRIFKNSLLFAASPFQLEFPTSRLAASDASLSLSLSEASEASASLSAVTPRHSTENMKISIAQCKRIQKEERSRKSYSSASTCIVIQLLRSSLALQFMQIQQTCKTHLENRKKPDNNDDNNNNKIRNSTISCMENYDTWVELTDLCLRDLHTKVQPSANGAQTRKQT